MTEEKITAADIEHALQVEAFRYFVTPEGDFKVEDGHALIYWDVNVPKDEQGWAYRLGDPYDCDSGPIDTWEDLIEVLRRI